MNIGLVVVAYNSGRDLTRLLDSARVGPGDSLRVELFLHSADAETVAACEDAEARYGNACHLRDLRRNAGLSRAWNTGALGCYRDGADVAIIANDDVVFGDGDLRRLAAHAVSHRDGFIAVCGGYHERFQEPVPSHGYSCFALQPLALEVLGCFDENLFPAYFEDCDYGHRAALAGLEQSVCKGTSVAHVGSGTIHRDPELNQRNHATFTRNQDYYIRKWGGSNGHEEYSLPFNDPSFSLRIAPGQRHQPYGPPHDRTNLEAAAVRTTLEAVAL